MDGQVFYLNLPLGGVTLILLWLFLRVKWDRKTKVGDKLRRIDVAGNALLATSTVAVLIALTWAGVTYPWSSYRVLAPLILGLLGMAGFLWIESSGWIREPVMPIRLFANRTSSIIFINTFLISMLNYWIFFFLPLYFQSVQLSSPAYSGVQILPITLIAIPGAAIGAICLSKLGRFKVLHIVGFAVLTAGMGSLAVLDRTSSTAEWVCLQILPSLGAGMILDTLLPPFQAGVSEADSAAATASWTFIRSFGNVWGVAVPASVFNTYTDRLASAMITSDASAQAALRSGDAYGSATASFVKTYPEPTQSQIIEVFTLALRNTFLVSLAFGGLAFLFTFWEREVKLRTELQTEFGLEENLDGKKQSC